MNRCSRFEVFPTNSFWKYRFMVNNILMFESMTLYDDSSLAWDATVGIENHIKRGPKRVISQIIR